MEYFLKDSTILLADSGLALAWKVDVRTKSTRSGYKSRKCTATCLRAFTRHQWDNQNKNRYPHFDNSTLGTSFYVSTFLLRCHHWGSRAPFRRPWPGRFCIQSPREPVDLLEISQYRKCTAQERQHRDRSGISGKSSSRRADNSDFRESEIWLVLAVNGSFN